MARKLSNTAWKNSTGKDLLIWFVLFLVGMIISFGICSTANLSSTAAGLFLVVFAVCLIGLFATSMVALAWVINRKDK